MSHTKVRPPRKWSPENEKHGSMKHSTFTQSTICCTMDVVCRQQRSTAAQPKVAEAASNRRRHANASSLAHSTSPDRAILQYSSSRIIVDGADTNFLRRARGDLHHPYRGSKHHGSLRASQRLSRKSPIAVAIPVTVALFSTSQMRALPQA